MTDLKNIIVALTVVVLATSGCEYANFPEDPIVIIDTTVPVSYTGDIQPIFNTNCTGCHPGVFAGLDLTAANSYNQLMVSGSGAPYIDTITPTSSLLYEKMTNTGGVSTYMPPSGILPSSTTDLLLLWIQQGAKNN